jgi:hypothetical protein
VMCFGQPVGSSFSALGMWLSETASQTLVEVLETREEPGRCRVGGRTNISEGDLLWSHQLLAGACSVKVNIGVRCVQVTAGVPGLQSSRVPGHRLRVGRPRRPFQAGAS